MKTSIRVYFSLVLLMVMFLPALSQQNKLSRIKDSLLVVLEQYEKNRKGDSLSLADTSRLSVMNKLATSYFRISENQNLFLYVTKANSLALRLLAIPSYSSNTTLKRELAQSYLTLSVYYELVGDSPKSLENHFKCVKIREELGDHMGVAEATNIAGNLYKNQANYAKGLDMYLKALTIRQKIQRQQPDNKANKKGIAGLYNNIGLVYKMQKKYDEAVKIFLKSLELKQSLGEELSAANTMGNLGTAYTEMKNFALGNNYHREALKIQEEYGDKRGIATTHFNIAENLIMTAQNSPENKRPPLLAEAKQHLDKTFSMAKDIGDPSVMKDFYRAYTSICELQKNYGDAMENYKLYIHYRDSLINSENIQKTVREEMNNEFQKKELIVKQKQEAKEELNRRENEKHKTVRNLFIVGFACLLIFAILVFVSVRQKQKANYYMSLQKQEVEIQKTIAEKKQKQIIDSINYAQRIQSSILPEPEDLRKIIPESLVLYLPKDIVSGDFYWFAPIAATGEIMIVVGDCTGQGVPGAFLSMVGTTLLNEIVVHITICLLNPSTHKISMAAVNQLTYMIDKNGLKKIEPQISSEDGIFDLNATLTMSTLPVNIEKETWIYLVTDGFISQINDANEEYGSERFGALLEKIHTLPPEEQHKVLEQTFTDWKGSSKQLDDILVMGFKV
ncbi:MAG: hypothetical protein K0S12_707 [Bacteroidetes bacterium]|nr:hypothetical protein [Bacteroidota bacterium]